jgi:hypothetical protein
MLSMLLPDRPGRLIADQYRSPFSEYEYEIPNAVGLYEVDAHMYSGSDFSKSPVTESDDMSLSYTPGTLRRKIRDQRFTLHVVV